MTDAATDIQVDMFEVKLGAAILMQFRTGDDSVRVLADGGVTGYKKDHVHRKLDAAFDAFDPKGARRIDLIIGTHYDADHLDGLVAIIADESIEIGETWLPPVANDAQWHALGEEPGDAGLLALQFAGERGDAALGHYLAVKAEQIGQLASTERAVGEYHKVAAASAFAEMEAAPLGYDEERAPDFFARHLAEAERLIGREGRSHADDPIGEQADLRELLAERPFAWMGLGLEPSDRWKARADFAESDQRSLALLRIKTAQDAITATSLFAVVKALKARSLPIRCAIVDDATPRRFIWDAAAKRFRPSAATPSDGPELLLLAPSKFLVKKHWDKLPIATYAKIAMSDWLPIAGLTESNELSYVVKFSHAGQGLLITGDAGFIDFRPQGTRDFYPAMLAALTDLHVVQIAHHAGANGYFYNGLLAAPFATQADRSYLLLSHGIKDIHRPSELFSRFIEQLERPGRDIELLFTSRPLEPKVRDVKHLFAPVVPGPPADCGDIRLTATSGKWTILQHAIAQPKS